MNGEEHAGREGAPKAEPERAREHGRTRRGLGVPREGDGVERERRAPEERVDGKRESDERPVEARAGEALPEERRPLRGRSDGEAALEVGVIEPDEPPAQRR